MLKSILMLAYNVELIDVAEKERLLSDVEGRILYTRKAEVYGCCVKLLTELDYVADRWDDNSYSMAENVRSHGRLVVLEEPDRPLTVKYEPLTKTTFLENVDYYGWVKNIALAAAFLAAENGGTISMEHLIKATKREYQKMGKLCTETDFGEYYELVTG